MEQIQCLLTKSLIELKPTFGNSANSRFSVLYWKPVCTCLYPSFIILQVPIFDRAEFCFLASNVHPSIP